jgi:hypothetical protein
VSLSSRLGGWTRSIWVIGYRAYDTFVGAALELAAQATAITTRRTQRGPVHEEEIAMHPYILETVARERIADMHAVASAHRLARDAAEGRARVRRKRRQIATRLIFIWCELAALPVLGQLPGAAC